AVTKPAATGLAAPAPPAPSAQDTADCRGSDNAKAVAACTRIIEYGTRQPAAVLADAYHFRGLAHGRAGNHDIAIADFSEALRVRTGYGPSYASRGVAYANRGNSDAAFTDYSEAIRINPKDGVAWSNRSGINLRRGNIDAAIADASEALRIRPNHIGALINRAEAWQKKGDAAKARADISAALAMTASTDFERRRLNDARNILASLDAAAAKPAAPVTGPTSTATPRPVTPPPVASAAPPPAYDATKPQRRVALVVGIGAYASAAHLEHPQSDAREFASALRRLGFDDVIERRDATLAELEADLKSFGDLAAVADWAVLYFSGHILQVDGRNHLLPADAKLARIGHLADETLDLERILDKVREARAIKLVILDACRVNPFAANLAKASGGRSIKTGIAAVAPKGNEVISVCGSDGQVIDDGDGRHAPFTRELLGLIEDPNMDLARLLNGAGQALARATAARALPKLYGVLPSGSIPLKTGAR
ncbi:MAG TPA: caspase family protein, partial [Hyphomicrobiaceae bacterium]|nr:caspase family protein [Hyphomicrobiaceae bacterium]